MRPVFGGGADGTIVLASKDGRTHHVALKLELAPGRRRNPLPADQPEGAGFTYGSYAQRCAVSASQISWPSARQLAKRALHCTSKPEPSLL